MVWKGLRYKIQPKNSSSWFSFLVQNEFKRKHRDSKNDWRDLCVIKMNNLEFSQLLTNLKILSEI